MFLNLKSFLFTSVILFGSLPAFANLCDGRSDTAAVAIQNAAFKKCDQLVPEDLAKITELNVWSESDPDTYTKMLPGDYKGLTELRKLTLLGSFTTIPSDAFSDLKNLKTLFIQNFEIHTLPSGIFSGLPNLRELDIASTLISTLPLTIFNDLTSLEELRLTILSDMSEPLFHNLTHLKYLSVGASEAAGGEDDEGIVQGSISVDAFKNLESLLGLEVYRVALPLLPTINHLKNLRTVWFSDTAVTSLPSDHFVNMESLESISIPDNNISTIPAGYFATNKNLEKLNIVGTLLSAEEITRIQSEYPNVEIKF
jgi:Leucine-rich repeat (LRR) protein